MRVTFVQPIVNTSLFENKFRDENLGLCSMAAVLRATGHTVLLLYDSLDRRPIEEAIVLLATGCRISTTGCPQCKLRTGDSSTLRPH